MSEIVGQQDPTQAMDITDAANVTDLDTPLLRISAHDHWTLRDAFNGLHCWGGIGAGKTSGTGKAVATALLRAGFGGLGSEAKKSASSNDSSRSSPSA